MAAFLPRDRVAEAFYELVKNPNFFWHRSARPR
jgi:hypothetical protein